MGGDLLSLLIHKKVSKLKQAYVLNNYKYLERSTGKSSQIKLHNYGNLRIIDDRSTHCQRDCSHRQKAELK